nr:hypothetical protein [Tanacetum cinerariifolium]
MYQVTLDALELSSCYPTFLITAEVPEVYMHQFWNTIKKIKDTDAYRFKLDKQKFQINTEVFHEILQIYPRLPNQDFVEPPSEEEMVPFIKELGYTGKCDMLFEIHTDHMHQPWRTFAAVINRCISEKSTEEEPAKKPKRAKKTKPAKKTKTAKKTALAKKSSTMQTVGVVIRDTPVVSVSKKKAQAKVDRGKGMDLLSDVALLEAAQLKKVLKKSNQDNHMLHASSSSNEVGSQPKVHDELKEKTTGINKGTDDVTEEEYERINEELYGDVNVRLTDAEPDNKNKGDKEMTNAETKDAEHVKVNQEGAGNQVKDDAQATQKAECPIPSSFISFEITNLEKDVKELKTVDHSAALLLTIKSKVPNAIKEYLGTSLDDALHKVLQKHSIDITKEHTMLAEIVERLKQQYVPEKSTKDIRKIKMEHARKQHKPKETITLLDTTTLTKFDQNTTLFETMTKSKSFNKSLKQRALYHVIIESILEVEDAMDKGVADKLKKRKHDDADKDEDETVFEAGDTQEPQNQGQDMAYVINHLKIDKMTQEHLVGPTFNLLKGTCKSRVELEYNFEECYKALTDQLYWNNPKGKEYPFDLSKPLPLTMVQAPIAPPFIMPPSPMLSPSLNPRDFFCHEEILPPKKRARGRSSSSTSALPQVFKIGESSHVTRMERHEEQIDEILNHLDELSLDRIEHVEEKTEGHDDEIVLSRIRTSTLEMIIEDIQVRHRSDKKDLLDAIYELKNRKQGPPNY